MVLTVRADFYAELMGTPLWPQIKANRVDVGPLDEAGLREAIDRPAETVGVYVESALVERLASDAVEARSQGILPLVQEVLVQLWDKLERRVLPLHAYESFVLARAAYDHHHEGQQRTGLEVAIARHADGVLKQLEVEDPGQVEIARRIFLRLIQFGEGRPDTRRQQAVAQLRAGNDPVRFEATLNALARNRLITLTGDLETGRRRADIAHEALIRGWPRLQRWIEDSRKAEEVRRKLERKAQEWIDAGAGTEGLLGTGGLAEAEAWVASPDGRELPEDDPIRRLIRETRAEIHRAEIAREAARQRELDHARQRVKILLRSAAFLGALLVGLVVVTLFAFQARRQAKINQAEAEKQAGLAAVNQTKAEAKEAEARQSEATARRMTVDVLIDSGANLIGAGSRSAALAVFARALALQADASRDQAFSRQRVGFLGQEVPRLRAVLEHADAKPVGAAVFSPDGSRVLSAGLDNVARVWDARSGKALAELKGHSDSVVRASFSPDGSRAVTASDDGTARVWDPGSGKSIAELKGHTAALRSAGFSPDGARVVTASLDHTARVWDARTGRSLAVLEGHTGPVNSAAFSPDGTRVVTASLRPHGPGLGRRLRHDRRRAQRAQGAGDLGSIQPDGARVATASMDRTAKVWDPGSGKITAELKGHDDPVISAVFSPDGARVVTASQDATARVWETTTGKTLAVLRGHAGLISSAAFSPDGLRVVTSSADFTARIWDPDTGKCLADARGHRSMVGSASFSPDNTRLLTACTDGAARIWEIGPRTSVAKLSEHTDGVSSAAFSPDGARLVTASHDKTARIWDATSGTTIVVLKAHAARLYSVAFSPDGGAWSRPRTTARPGSGTRDRAGASPCSRGTPDRSTPPRSAPTAARVVTASDDRTARVWDARSGRSLAVLRRHERDVASTVFSPDGSWILTASMDGTVRLWDAATGRDVAKLGQSLLPVISVAFSPDGTRIVTASYSGTAQLWDFATRKSLVVFKGHEGVVYSATFDPAGLRVVTAGADHTARVWDASSGQLIVELKGHAATVFFAAFSPDGRRILTASEDKTARIWSLDPIPGDPEAIALWVEVLTGIKLDGDGGLTAAEWNERRSRLKAMGDKAPPRPGWTTWSRRSIHPSMLSPR